MALRCNGSSLTEARAGSVLQGNRKHCLGSDSKSWQCWAVVGRVDSRSQPGKRPFANYWSETISILSCRWQILVCGLWANHLVSLSFSFSVCKMGIVETFISQAYREEYIHVCKQWNNTEYGVHQDSRWSRSPPRIKGREEFGMTVGYWRTRTN